MGMLIRMIARKASTIGLDEALASYQTEEDRQTMRILDITMFIVSVVGIIALCVGGLLLISHPSAGEVSTAIALMVCGIFFPPMVMLARRGVKWTIRMETAGKLGHGLWQTCQMFWHERHNA